ncbi:MAG: hypothetical protein JO107_00505 [Hyphomicrobiales bacterium]|nr:hypothetical protein [Hyphomicrobiales bacterium]MBV8661555.1 hypothetical protein [Hyphomicrobiales bacterium]
MPEPLGEKADDKEAVALYKSLFKAVLDKRPSGMRLRLAHALGKNRSFISQISNPAYPTPIPSQHLGTIIEVCHFSPAEKAAFLKAYGRAHPRRAEGLDARGAERAVVFHLPDLGDAKRNARLDALLGDFARGLVALMRKGK